MISVIKSDSALFVLLLELNEKNKQQNKRISDMFFVRVFIFQELLQAKKMTDSLKIICLPES
jgi:ABC-type transporter Mla MlaB component